MKKIISLFFAVLFGVCCFGCASEIELKSGIYVFENSGMMMDPTLEIDTEKQFFSFSYSMLSSCLPTGTYTIENNVLTAETHDGENTYRFQIVDENTLKYIVDGSSDIPSIGEKQTISEGSEFRRSFED